MSWCWNRNAGSSSGSGRDQVALGQRVIPFVDSGTLGGRQHVHERVDGEVTPDHRGRPDRLALGRREEVEAGRQEGLDGRRALRGRQVPVESPAVAHLPEPTVVHQHRQQLLEEQRVAVGGVDDPACAGASTVVPPSESWRKRSQSSSVSGPRVTARRTVDELVVVVAELDGRAVHKKRTGARHRGGQLLDRSSRGARPSARRRGRRPPAGPPPGPREATHAPRPTRPSRTACRQAGDRRQPRRHLAVVVGQREEPGPRRVRVVVFDDPGGVLQDRRRGQKVMPSP